MNNGRAGPELVADRCDEVLTSLAETARAEVALILGQLAALRRRVDLSAEAAPAGTPAVVENQVEEPVSEPPWAGRPATPLDAVPVRRL
jgi:hypothetical protein